MNEYYYEGSTNGYGHGHGHLSGPQASGSLCVPIYIPIPGHAGRCAWFSHVVGPGVTVFAGFDFGRFYHPRRLGLGL